MKKTTYDALSMIAVVSLVVFTVAAQYSRRGYIFGILVILTAAGLLAAYIKASPTDTSADPTPKVRAAKQSENPARMEALARNVREDLYTRLLLIDSEHAVHETLYKERPSAHKLLLSARAGMGKTALIAQGYYTHVKFHRDPIHDPASVIAKIVEKLCASSEEPRYEFILEPDGRFKIQQIPAKRGVSEPVSAREEVEEPREQSDPDKPLVVN